MAEPRRLIENQAQLYIVLNEIAERYGKAFEDFEKQEKAFNHLSDGMEIGELLKEAIELWHLQQIMEREEKALRLGLEAMEACTQEEFLTLAMETAIAIVPTIDEEANWTTDNEAFCYGFIRGLKYGGL